MNKKILILISGLTLTAISCAPADNNDELPAKPPMVSPKPLPSDCDLNAEVIFLWPTNSNVFKYEIFFGYNTQNFFESRPLSESATEFRTGFERDVKYVVRLERTDLSGSVQTQLLSFYLPSCDNRDEWQKKNPSYEEPLQKQFIF